MRRGRCRGGESYGGSYSDQEKTEEGCLYYEKDQGESIIIGTKFPEALCTPRPPHYTRVQIMNALSHSVGIIGSIEKNPSTNNPDLGCFICYK